MLTEICAEIKNYFSYRTDRFPGKYKIEGGTIVPAVDLKTDYFAVFGSRKNNGVHKVSDHDLVDEDEFKGAIWIMSPSKAFLDLCKDIADWQAKYGGVDSEALSPFYSESFGGYSYTKGAGSTSKGASTAATSWQTAFSSRLNLYRKVRL